MSNRLKSYSKYITEVKNTTLKNKVLFGDGFQEHLKCIDAIQYVEKLYQTDLKIGFKENVVWKNKQFTIIKICTSWWVLLQSYSTVELIQCILLKTMIFLLIIFKTNIHRGIMFLTPVVKIATHTLQTQNVLWHLEAVLK